MDNIKKIELIYEQILDEDRKTIINFFITFSFYEYVMKEHRTILPNKRTPFADWITYAKSLQTDFNEIKSEELAKSVKYLKENPPAKQRLKEDGSIYFDNEYFLNKSKIDLKVIFEMIKTVRNNFFHGGKVKDFMRDDYERNIELFKHCLVILDSCINIDDQALEFL